MTGTVSVGRFATMTHLSVKTLRHYHQVGLLEPAEVDPHTGYRYYALEQLPTAQLIRRLRDLQMPVADVRAVIAARATSERDSLIAAHIDRLEAELVKTQAAVHSLRTLLDSAPGPDPVRRRAESSYPALAITADIRDPSDIESWWRDALYELRAAVDENRIHVTGPAGGLYDECLFQHEPGEAIVYLPVTTPRELGKIKPLVIPAAEVAVTTHHGSHDDIDLAYAQLGSYIAEHELTVGWQLREYYHRDHSHSTDATEWRTEIAWPIIDAPGKHPSR
ncbi:MerR family transcriptional regulator [Mycobacterium sp. Aquia_213]|uniref:MerR family transcriptional regulator n=1 Tax=Mycobacterium sp. Aquia_213 TaxID=2991728 RepID=UPI00226F3839|nr:MerR family transcriptional regulator [Mycobacterium sp. Aquia_213]WAC93630.1 MerR family transcriptional regulator [Mycobacterium sp. Aquia_213]